MKSSNSISKPSYHTRWFIQYVSVSIYHILAIMASLDDHEKRNRKQNRRENFVAEEYYKITTDNQI